MAWLLRREELEGADAERLFLEQPVRAARAILAEAENGNAEARVLLGQILLEGRGIQADPTLAVSWFEIAAAEGQAMAHNMLGRCLEHGRGTAVDLPRAAQHYRQAAAAGLDWGCYNLANLLATGRGVARDELAALALYRQAAEAGHAKSMNLLGRYLEDGRIVPRDLNAAHAWYRRSAEAGDFRGQFSHACVLAETGRLEDAVAWLQRACAGGNLNFLRVAREQLRNACHTELRDCAPAYFRRAAELGDANDRQALARLNTATCPA